MNDNESIKIFEGKSIRTIRDEKQNKLFYSVVDIVEALTESQNPRKYWSVLKTRLLKEKSQLATNCSQLKLPFPDGKYYKTDVADNEQLIRLVQYISSPKTESFLHWLGHFNQSEIENRIYTIRSVQVMIDSDLAEMYDVETKVLNQAVKRNIERFPDQFLFQITEKEKNKLVTNCDRFSNLKHSSVLPFAFTEQGVAMLSAVLHSDTAIKVSIKIIQAFVEMRKLIQNSSSLYHRMNRIELKQNETDDKIEKIFKSLERKNEIPEKGIFYDGQIFDAWKFVSDIVRSAKSGIIIIDNYIDDRVLGLLTKRESGVKVKIYTNKISGQLTVDIEKHNSQYEPIIVKEFHLSHDRFLIIDGKQVYHIGSSLKDLGKRWFGFTLMKDEGIVNGLLERLDSQ